MREWRNKAKKDAMDALKDVVIGKDEYRFDIICDFPPRSVSSEVWKQLCLGWNTDKWLSKSVKGRANRTNESNGGGISRHTGGSIGFDERRIRLEKKHGRKIKWIEVFFDTHLKKESKEKFWAGELNINSSDLAGFEFTSDKSKEIYLKYRSDMIKLHGSDLNEHPDDLNVWRRVAEGKNGRVYGVGSSDPSFVVTGTSSTSGYFLNSQEEVKKVREELENAKHEWELKVQQLEKDAQENAERMQKQF